MSRNPVTPAVREKVMARAEGHCEFCGWDYPEQIHHRRARSAGGSRRPDTNLAGNLLAVSALCHGLIESRRELSYARGWLVRQGLTPADVPVLRRGGVWVLLDDDGGFEQTEEPKETA